MKKIAMTGLLLLASTASLATDLRDIELRRLFDPTPAELRAETRGRIYIYDGLKDIDVARAMSEEFDRLENMMFIRLKKTDPNGEVRKNPKTDEIVYEDDGC
jgi:hypothetical protein